MVSWSLLCEHALALGLLWGCTGLTGLVLLALLRIRTGLVSAPLLGVIYWTLVLYVFPFSGGMDLAAGLVTSSGGAALVRSWLRSERLSPFWKRFSWSTLILVCGSMPYTTTVWQHYLPLGMDGSMHTTAAALIARNHGLPANFAPFAADVPFPAVNLGLPAVAAVAIRWGGEPAAVMLATHHLTFACLILATYVLLRRWTARTSAAVLAVASVWLARASEATLGWGGFPTIMSVAIGLYAVRLLLQQAHRTSWRLSLATGAGIAAVPLIHGVGGGTWIYCAGIWTVLAALTRSSCVSATLRGLAQTGAWAVVFLAAYHWAGTLDVGAQDIEETRRFVQASAPIEEDWRAWFSAAAYVRKDSGSLIVLAGWGTCLGLMLRRRWSGALPLTGAWLTLITVVANARWYVLPGTFLLYPERVLYWAAPLGAVGLALTWRTVPQSWRRARSASALAAAILLVAFYFQNQFYQKIVREEATSDEGWEALVWARENLRPDRDFVQAPYNSAGSFLPSVAQIGCTGSHQHHFIGRQVQAAHAVRCCTHQFLRNPPDSDEASSTGRIVFRNRLYTVLELSPCSAANQRSAEQE